MEDRTPEPEVQRSHKATVLERREPPLPSATRAPRASSRRDQLAQYLEEPLSEVPLIEYWLAQEAQWP